jgi:hypothetical protein
VTLAKQQNEWRRYALVGAEQRLLEIAEEAAKIFRVFPELRARGRGFAALRGGGAPAAEQTGGPGRKRRRRRRTMSAEARKRISDAQKARWAKHRAEAAAKGAGARKKR